MDPITLTPHQQAAVDWLVAKLVAGETLVALRGLAGTGKTSIIPALQAALRMHNLSSVIGAPTHRAVMILRTKGLDAETVHSQALVPYFTADYRRACAWLGEDLPVCEGATESDPRADVEGLPWLVYEAVQPDLERGKALKRQRRYKAQRRLASLAISGKDHFVGFGPKAGEGVLIVDEASMVGEALLAICQKAYRQIVLVGDPGQLPPVKDRAMLAEVEGVDLTEIHRQAAESPIVQLAYQARAGEAFWQSLDSDPFSVGKPVRQITEVSARRFLTCPLLVWRNETRITSTQAIRQALGYTRDRLERGEPLVCRSTAQEDRVLGFFNNGLYTITETSADDPRLVTVKDALGDAQAIRVHLEELDGDFVDPRAIPFRFGYALTVHTAQGGEWPRVYISLPDVKAYAGFVHRHSRHNEFAQWTYTAITRAKDVLRFLSHHIFTSPQERTTMSERKSALETQEPALLDALPTAEERLAALPTHAVTARAEETAIFGADDITDPTVPLSLQDALQTAEDAPGSTNAPPPDHHAPEVNTACEAQAETPGQLGKNDAIIQAFCAHFMKRFDAAVNASVKEITKGADGIYEFVHDQMEIQREKTQRAETFLDTLTAKAVTQGIQLRQDAYSTQVGPMMSPQGFPVTITFVKQSNMEVVEELNGIVVWLAENRYKPA